MRRVQKQTLRGGSCDHDLYFHRVGKNVGRRVGGSLSKQLWVWNRRHREGVNAPVGRTGCQKGGNIPFPRENDYLLVRTVTGSGGREDEPLWWENLYFRARERLKG